ncbi:hypothetical protein AX16_009954 [Volvariella volvacea WC 439]|nr:hypothetical protein AX16_009954 [Volvariella volvacea WC 439]
MRFFTATISSLFFIGTVLASPLLAPIERYSGETTGRYIVQLKEGAALPTVLESLGIEPAFQWESFNSFAGSFDDATLALIRASPDVERISEDGIMHTMTVTQSDAPWGLARISTQKSLKGNDPARLDYNYHYDHSAGEGVDIYVLDTGVRITHTDFGGRAKWGKTFGGYPDQDGNGHGTHCAATAAGTRFGVAKKASIIAVKVLSDEGSGSVTDIMCGINWVIQQADDSGLPSVISMSLGGGTSPPLDLAVKRATIKGIHVAVAAGNSNVDAANTSPAREPSAITVGASTIDDSRAFFSNYGSVVDIFAPGLNVTSAWVTDDSSTNRISGTSMATPHVAGLVAYLIGLEGNKSPADMSDRLKQLAQKGVLSGIPDGTVNLLAQNGIITCATCFLRDGENGRIV